MPYTLEAMRNLGAKSAAMLRVAGINSPAQLRRIGAVRAYTGLRALGQPASLNLLWALEGALTDTPWQAVAREHRMRLLLAIDDLNRNDDS
jgi:DNA transformation protein